MTLCNWLGVVEREHSTIVQFLILFSLPISNQLNQIERVLFVVKDIEGYDEIKQSLDSLKEETDKWLKSNFEQWRDQSMAAISQGDLTYGFANTNQD